MACSKLHLRDLPEMNMDTNAQPPSGEIYIKGNNVFLGYFKNPKLTAEVLDSEGWLKTGDIGRLNKNGSIELIDRIESFAKL